MNCQALATNPLQSPKFDTLATSNKRRHEITVCQAALLMNQRLSSLPRESENAEQCALWEEASCSVPVRLSHASPCDWNRHKPRPALRRATRHPRKDYKIVPLGGITFRVQKAPFSRARYPSHSGEWTLRGPACMSGVMPGTAPAWRTVSLPASGR